MPIICYIMRYFQDISHLIGTEDSKLVQLPSGRDLKFKFQLKSKKSDAYAKLDDSDQTDTVKEVSNAPNVSRSGCKKKVNTCTVI